MSIISQLFNLDKIIEFTIIIPAHNESKNIVKLLNSIKSSIFVFKVKIDVIVIVNGSTDNTYEVVKQYIQQNKIQFINWIVKKTSFAHKSRSVNIGLKLSNNEININIDADCILDSKCLNIVIQAIQKPDITLVGASDIPIFSDFMKDTLLYQYLVTQHLYRKYKKRTYPIGRFYAYKKSLINKFPIQLHSDDLWITLYLANIYGWKTIKMPSKAMIYYYPPTNWLDFIKQESRWMCGFPQLIKFYPEFQEIFNHRYDHVSILNDKIIHKNLKKIIEKQKIPPQRLEEYIQIIHPIFQDNYHLQQNSLIDNIGRWQSVESTKCSS